jgi:hypothetical protein
MPDILHFLNIEYLYYLIYTLFFGWGGLGAGKIPGGEDGAGEAGAGGAAGEGGSVLSQLLDAIASTFSAIWSAFELFAFALSLLLAGLIVYAVAALWYIRMREDEELYSTVARRPAEPLEASRFEKILDDAAADDPRRWKQAVMDADLMLHELLRALGYPGETATASLRAVPHGAFSTLSAAWEAHRAKSIIESGTSDYILTKQEALRIVRLYNDVFDEFNFA